ncbi:hypothetical protein H2O64_17970 [Kordia sp. YSTF-M3]|uniref:Uncharacterized protein n=1 Tax=Kordia aestuariivivens TaxID=2759037 RepID=A0ABR7QDD4_9FLAO|nr:hypothetical protein [Kordia aestuariivivens]MBC8756564.1 hypothetical protein [Kordia aestuariivivens]
MPTPQFYPALSKLIRSDKLPEPIKSVVDNTTDKLFYKTYYVEKSIYGETAYHHIVLVFNKEIGFNLFGGEEGFELLFNPGSATNTTELPLAIYYNLPIVKYIKKIQLGDLNSVEDYFNLLLEMFNVSKEELLFEVINGFLGEETDPFLAFVDEFNNNPDYNALPPLTLPQEANDYDKITNLITQLQTRNLDLLLYTLENYVDIADFSGGFENLSTIFKKWMGEFTLDTIIDLFIPKFSVSLEQLELALAFPRKWLKPVDANGEVIEGEDEKSMLIYNVGSMSYHSEHGFEFNQADSFNLTPSQIGNTGLLIDIDNLKFDFRTDRNIPEATADGRPDEFRGFYAETVAITLPKKWFNNVDNATLKVAGYNMLIGTGGVSGTIALETVAPGGDGFMPVNIGNWELGFKDFDITFKQNAVIESNIEGRLLIPKLEDGDGNEALIEIKGHLNDEGDFNLTASEPQGIPLNLFNFVTINFLTLELGREEGNFYIGTSCEISFQNEIMIRVLGDQKIVIPKLRVYDDGSIEIVGGNAFIPTNISLNLGPIEIAVTGIHFGSHQQEKNGVMRKYNYWGFDGAISLDPLGIDARGEGIKYYYTTDNDEHDDDGDSFLRIQTIEVDLIIPGTANPDSALAIINGMLSIPEPGESPEYEGKIGLKLPKARISGAAHMRLQPKEPAFIIEAGIEMPTPIPLAATGLAFYGFGGLLGFKYVAEKEAIGLVSGENTWYEYYTYPQRGVNINKFSGPPRTDQYELPVAVGAGTVLGTMHDDGFLFSTRLMAILSLPSVFILDGRANVLGERLGIIDSTEPPFFAGVAVGDNSFEFWFGADYQLPKSNGWILDLYAEVQAGFFFNNPSAWYLNFGTKQSPITARVLTIITAQTFLMLSARGIEAGARVDLSLKKNFFGIKVEISAYVEVGGFISFERFQLGGYIAFGGTISISVWKIVGFRVSLDAILSAEAAKPFLLFAQVRIRVCIRIIVKICKTFKVKLKWEKNKQVDRTPIPALSDGSNPNYPDRTKEAVQGVHMMTNETFELNYFATVPNANNIDKVIPLDTYIDFKAMKGLVPGAISSKIGGHTGGANNFTDLIPPNKVVRGGHELRQVKHKYSIENIAIKMWNGSAWQDYHPYEAVVPTAERPDVSHLRIGYWQRNGDQYDSIRLLATNPFSYMEAGEPGWFIPEEYGITPSELYCVTTLETGDCSDMLEKLLGTKYYRPNGYIGHFIDGAYYSIEEGNDDLEETTYVQNMTWSLPLIHSASGQDYTRANFDRMRIRINGANTYVTLGVNEDFYTLENGAATNLIEISEQYLTAINTILLDNNSAPLDSLEITEVSVDNGNLIVNVEVKSEYEFTATGANELFFSAIYLKRFRDNGTSSVLASAITNTTEIILTTNNEPTAVGCMEITDVENNFDYAQSLQFSNADRLIIILPEASVTTDLKLTTYAEGVTIRYYKTLLSDTNSTPDYEEIHQVYKTRAELENVISYTNENELTSKITVTPKSANAHLIRQVREEIAELLEATYDSETGQIIELTPAQQARYDELVAELERLEAEGCSTETVEVTTLKQRIIAEIYNEIDTDGIDEYRFRVYNEKCEIVLSSSTRYYTKEAAVSELKTSVFAIINESNSIEIKQTKTNKYYFNVIDNTGEVIARRIEYFDTLRECESEITNLKLLLSTSEMAIGEVGCGEAAKDNTLQKSAIQTVQKSVFINEYSNQTIIDDTYLDTRRIGDHMYIVGFTTPDRSIQKFPIFIKLDENGETIYRKVFDVGSKSPSAQFTNIEEFVDGNILVTLEYVDRNKAAVVKFDSDGKFIWKREINRTFKEGIVSLQNMLRPIPSGEFFFIPVNYTYVNAKGVEVNIADVYYLDKNGDFVKNYNLSDKSLVSTEITAVTSDNSRGIILGMMVTDGDAAQKACVARYDAGFNEMWNRIIDQSTTKSNAAKIETVHKAGNGNYYVISRDTGLVFSTFAENDIQNNKVYTKILNIQSAEKISFVEEQNYSSTYNTVAAYTDGKIYEFAITIVKDIPEIKDIKMIDYNSVLRYSNINKLVFDAIKNKHYILLNPSIAGKIGVDYMSCIALMKLELGFKPDGVDVPTNKDTSIVVVGVEKVEPTINGSEASIIIERIICEEFESNDCEKDPIICDAYDNLVRIYNECFVGIETSEQVDASIRCFEEFRDIIKNLLVVPGISLPSSIGAEYENYNTLYNLIVGLVGHHEQILRFRDLNDSAILLMQLIEAAGNCNCNEEVPHICNTSLQQVCWLSIEKFEYNETIPGQPAIQQEQEDMEEAVQRTAQPIWRPNSKYYVHYQLKDEVDNGENQGVFDYYYGFETAGPVGHFHNADGVTYGNEYDESNNIKNRADANGILTLSGELTNPDSYPLTSLRQYIDYTRSYPNADGNLLQAKPVFYGQEQCRITLYFTKPLAFHMLNTWESYLGAPELTGSMHIAIKDPVTNVTIPYPLPIDYNEDTVPLPEGNGEGGVPWVDDNDPRIPLNIRILNNFINYINENDDAIQCDFMIGNAIKPQSYAYSVTLTNLKPRKLYTALIFNAFETASNDVVTSEQVHNYVFQTSRYQNFGAQVNSYLLVDENDVDNPRQAVFEVALPAITASEITTAYNIVVGNSDTDSNAIETQYLDVFDRVLEGVLGMTPLDPPINTEFNKILDGGGNIVALLIRNPEPFNIPKIPIEKINGTEEIFEAGSTDGERGAIRVINTANDQDDPAYKVLYSKDYSQALIMHESKKITAVNLSFRFRYMIWNGTEYVIEDTIQVDDITIA